MSEGARAPFGKQLAEPQHQDRHLNDRDTTMTRRRDAGFVTSPSTTPLTRRALLAGTAGTAAVALSGCSTGAEQLFSGGGSGTTITVAIVSNPQMQDAISLSSLFQRDHPGINLKFVSLPEN